ncbi:carbamoyl-phosphate synthase (glutamine-hydrolyzing) large subunit [Virgibacillus oceani]|uniref:Carbamoyl phosphate synthase large chain n=1 Tax=Virgibacillus oceani TaxID=1479511 RepID=A0A917HA58_9BACI|nr:carbamoyl-phosphate synthase (glutamine-hydrolyzing) large subunit [Virgibacillus oceani]GGG72014.1 carbamoyl-phosphate synthase pyrimidine-specific large chain [Virgibacillus oceani]
MPKLSHISKVLVIGSGPIVIGQAAEFDYAGTQACLALKEEGVEVILVNNNPATIMTDQAIADQVYLEPLTLESLTEIVKKENPDGILPTLGGQTGLNLAVSLSKSGILDQFNVELLGTPLDTIQKGEDRELFKSLMGDIGEPVAKSLSTVSADEAVQFSVTTGYPIIVRPAYTLGGAGGGIANNEQELKAIVKNGIHASPIGQVLVEQSVKGWKEIEYEVMRDANDTCIIVCNMENIDPVGIHTGDSIVVAPSQTLNDRQYQMLRSTSCKVIRELGVVGGCNIQFALNPESDEYVIIEVNPRVSRSSALASKATGYPIARIAAKLALGYHLDELLNPITGSTYASFEPAIDYIAVKIPRWPFDKFAHADRLLGTQMMATGEVMALARNFPAALNKAVRSLEIGLEYVNLVKLTEWTNERIDKALREATDERLFVVAEAFRRGYKLERIHELTEINKFFLNEIASMISMEKALLDKNWDTISKDEWVKVKMMGFPDSLLTEMFKKNKKEVRELWKNLDLAPSYKMVDTCAAEFTAQTPYFYSTWNEFDEVESLTSERKVVVLGSGPIRIGQGVEFDYCSVHAAMALQEQGVKAIVINNNPETVSTDFNTADHLYFEALTEEDVLHVIEKENADGVFVQFGGQTAINLAEGLSEAGVSVYGTTLQAIEAAEDRDKFYQLLGKLDIPHIPGETVTNTKDAVKAAGDIGYPVLLRPSYVIGGQGMVVLYDQSQLLNYLEGLKNSDPIVRTFPLLIDKFIPGFEVEIDVVCDGKDIVIPGIFQHVERAGIHSGDSIAIFPSPDLNFDQKKLIERYTQLISEELALKGIVNIQFVLSEDKRDIYVLEVNPRASRTVPIASKVTGVPLVDLATRVQMGQPLKELGLQLGLHEDIPYYAVKMPVFSTNKIAGADPYLGPEMQSTGEAIGIGKTVGAAMAKAFGWKEHGLVDLQDGKPIFLSLCSAAPKELVHLLENVPVKIAADHATAKMLGGVNINVEMSITEAQETCLNNGFQLICDTHKSYTRDEHAVLREDALKSSTACFTSMETLIALLQAEAQTVEAPCAIDEYLQKKKNIHQMKERVF